MNGRLNGLWLAAIIAAAEFFHLGRSFTPATASTAETKTEQQTQGSTATKAKVRTGKELLEDYDVAGNTRSNLRFIVATVPDPIDARAAYKFDEILEALQEGAQDSRYVLDRFYLPWPRKGDPSAPPEKDLDRSEPGILLLRGDGPNNFGQPCLVYLIGETPTAGIHKEALIHALQEAGQLLPSMAEVRVVGPNFSGSAPSIKNAITAWAQEDRKGHSTSVHFLSGNATSTAARKLLHSPDVPWAKGLSTNFHGLVWSDDHVRKAITKYLHEDLGVDETKIATLAESDSAYGRYLMTLTEQTDKGSHTFPYPLHVSELRSSYRETTKDTERPTSIAADRTRAALDLSFDEAANPVDIPRPYSPGPTANLAELSVYNIISGLNREHIQYVALYGTDSRDKLFLARIIRMYFPAIQFFTTETDLLYTHPYYSAEMVGTLVASTYPMANQTQTWKFTARPVRQFSSQGAEGAYNATVAALLERTPVNIDAKYESVAADDLLLADTDGKLIDYKDPFHISKEPNRPLIWISVVGRDRLWPIAVYSPSGGQKISEPDISNSKRSRSFLALFGGFTLCCVLALLIPLIRARGAKKKKLRVRPTPNEQLYRCLFYVSLLLFFAVIAGTAFFVRPWTWLTPIVIIAYVMIVFLLGQSAAYAGLKAMWPKGGRKYHLWLSIILATGLLGVVITWSLGLVQGGSTPYDILLAERASRLSSGVSPFLPFAFLIAGTCIWLACDLKRIEQIRRVRLRPFAPDFEELCARIQSALTRWTIGLDSQKFLAFVAAVAFVVIGALWILNFFRTFEGMGFNSLLRTIFVFLIVGISVSATRFFMIWYQLRRLLRRLTFHPIADAFKRLDPKFARGLGTHFTAGPPTLMELEESVSMLARLKHRLSGNAQLQKISSRLASSYPPIEERYKEELAEASSRIGRAWSFNSLTQKLLSKEAAFMFEQLQPEWKSPVADEKVMEACEDFIAVQIVGYLNYVFLHLRYLLTCTASGAILLFLATASYPFYLQNVMIDFAWAVILTLAGTYLVIFSEMSKNVIIVRVASGPGGSDFKRGFIPQVVVFGIIPVVTFFGSQFPILGQILFSWLAPAVKAFSF